MSTSKHHIERLTGLLKDRVVREEGEEWGATEMGGSVVFTLFGKRGVWSCGPDGCDGKGFLLSVQGYSKRRPLPASYKDALEEDKKNPSPPKAWIRLTPAPDNSTDVDFYADKEWQPLFESLVSELVDPVQTQKGAKPKGKPGRPGLEREEEVRRVAFALWGEELKEADGQIPWKEIAQEIGWPQGSDDSALHTLKYARDKLVCLRRRDPEGILKEAIRALPELKARPKETK